MQSEAYRAIEQRFNAEYEKPHTAAAVSVLGQDLTDDEYRTLLLQPDVEGIRQYAVIVGDQQNAALRIAFLGSLYLVHAHNWSLASEFIISGGLNALLPLFRHENQYLKSQAMEIFQSLTSPETYNWFDPPETERALGLHRAMLQIETQDFVALCAEDNFKSTFPGASYIALQLLAFWLSWARLLHIGDRPLCLTAALLLRLKAWSQRPVRGYDATPVPAPTDGAGGGGVEEVVDPGITAEEAELAKKVFEDFNRFPAAEDAAVKDIDTVTTDSKPKPVVDDEPHTRRKIGVSHGHLAFNARGGLAMEQQRQKREKAEAVRAAKAAEKDSEENVCKRILDQAERLKTLGNDAVGARLSQAAVQQYSRALPLVQQVIEQLDTKRGHATGLMAQWRRAKTLLATLFANRSAVMLSRGRAKGVGGPGAGDNSTPVGVEEEGSRLGEDAGVHLSELTGAEALQQCVRDADAALHAEPKLYKAYYRKASALRELSRFSAAQVAAETALEVLEVDLKAAMKAADSDADKPAGEENTTESKVQASGAGSGAGTADAAAVQEAVDVSESVAEEETKGAGADDMGKLQAIKTQISTLLGVIRQQIKDQAILQGGDVSQLDPHVATVYAALLRRWQIPLDDRDAAMGVGGKEGNASSAYWRSWNQSTDTAAPSDVAEVETRPEPSSSTSTTTTTDVRSADKPAVGAGSSKATNVDRQGGEATIEKHAAPATTTSGAVPARHSSAIEAAARAQREMDMLLAGTTNNSDSAKAVKQIISGAARVPPRTGKPAVKASKPAAAAYGAMLASQQTDAVLGSDAKSTRARMQALGLECKRCQGKPDQLLDDCLTKLTVDQVATATSSSAFTEDMLAQVIVALGHGLHRQDKTLAEFSGKSLEAIAAAPGYEFSSCIFTREQQAAIRSTLESMPGDVDPATTARARAQIVKF